MSAHEYNFDGLVGPTHNYAGLSYGNLASMKSANKTSNPRAAALQGLEKMRFVASLGVKQAILPPHERPHLPTLRRLGFAGNDEQVIEKVAQENRVLLAAICSSSHMWSANAATVSPSADTSDGRVHFTPANLITQFHRSIEAPATTRILRKIFADKRCFELHDPLPAAMHFADEGAANHTRLAPSHGDAGFEFMVYGRSGFDAEHTSRFPSRQTLEACTAIFRRHGVSRERCGEIRQNLSAIDAGAFHNDVVAVGHRDVLLMHEMAFDRSWVDHVAGNWFQQTYHRPLHVIEVKNEELTLADAIATYLFNSQVVSLPDVTLAMIAPIECQEHPAARAVCERIVAESPIRKVHYVDVRQSMRNGGGPACLRLRVPLTDKEARAMHQGVVFTDELYVKLKAWVIKHYRETLEPLDLADPRLLKESRDALDELTRILNLGNIYEFQTV